MRWKRPDTGASDSTSTDVFMKPVHCLPRRLRIKSDGSKRPCLPFLDFLGAFKPCVVPRVAKLPYLCLVWQHQSFLGQQGHLECFQKLRHAVSVPPFCSMAIHWVPGWHRTSCEGWAWVTSWPAFPGSYLWKTWRDSQRPFTGISWLQVGFLVPWVYLEYLNGSEWPRNPPWS